MTDCSRRLQYPYCGTLTCTARRSTAWQRESCNREPWPDWNDALPWHPQRALLERAARCCIPNRLSRRIPHS